MSKKSSPRRWAKRKTRRLYRRMDDTMAQLLDLKKLFDPDHPELGEVLDMVAKTVLVAQDLLSKFHLAAWGNIPGDWYTDM